MSDNMHTADIGSETLDETQQRLAHSAQSNLVSDEKGVKKNYLRWVYIFLFLVLALAIGGWALQRALGQLLGSSGHQKSEDNTSPFMPNRSFDQPVHSDAPPLMPAQPASAAAPIPIKPNYTTASTQSWGASAVPQQPQTVTREQAARQMRQGSTGIGDGSKSSPAPSVSIGGIGTVEEQATQIARSRGEITRTKQSVAGKFGNLDYLIPRGFRIGCLNKEEFSSDKLGDVSCKIDRDVYSFNGSRLLIPKGSEAQGKSGGSVSYGDTRVAVVYDRITEPDGTVIDFESPMGDSLGTVGFAGNTDRHWGLKLGAAFGLSAFKDLMALGVAEASKSSRSSSGNSSGNTTVLPSSTMNTSDQLATAIASKTLNVQDTISIPRAQQMTILVAQDMWFLPKDGK